MWTSGVFTLAKILLIDDDADLRTFLLETLQQRGHQVWCLESAEEGLDVLADAKVDLVLTDVNMPRLSGIEFLKHLRKKQGVDLPVILMTGFAPSPIVQEVENLNALVVSKPMGGNSEFWKELEPKLEQALKGGPEAEIRAFLGRAFDVAFQQRQKDVARYLEEMLYSALLGKSMIQAGGNQKEAERILGIRLEELREKADASPEARHHRFVMRALTLIAKHPEWTVADYAAELDCSRARLYNDPIINGAIQRKKGSGRKLRSGFKDGDGNLEAID
jgi:DNA-binding NtrC family response regulator